MPAENPEDSSLQRIPDLRVAQTKFMLETKNKGQEDNRAKLLQEIESHQMAPFYKICCKDNIFTADEKLMTKLEAANKTALAQFEGKIEDAEKNLGESELRDALLAKAEYLAKIGDKSAAVEAMDKTLEKTVGVGNRMDLVFSKIRIGLFYMDHSLLRSSIDKAKQMMEEGGDWDRRNRLKVYEGLYAMSVRDFSKSAKLFLETVSTFTSYELMSYEQFVTYTVYVSMIALDRRQLFDKVVQGSEILEVLHACPDVKAYLMSLYECQYGEFFSRLAQVEDKLKADRFLHAHYAFYIREMKVKVFGQLLESYRSLTLTYMAEAFNVTEDYMDRELSRFIADSRLHCRIDKVRGIVITNRPDSKNAQYQATIKQGDILLNRVQKLSRVINI